MDIRVTFPGGKRVDAAVGALTIHTDQPVAQGGDGSAPAPFDLFLASLATCAGLYVVGFCQARGIPTEDLQLVQRTTSDPQTGRLRHVEIEVVVPSTFPAHYRDAVARAAAACKVKKTLADPPTFAVTTRVATLASEAA
jgi:ribosomal protein S12 methylthiotransferase accessory factor